MRALTILLVLAALHCSGSIEEPEPDNQPPELSQFDEDKAKCVSQTLTLLSNLRGYTTEETKRIALHMYGVCMVHKGYTGKDAEWHQLTKSTK